MKNKAVQVQRGIWIDPRDFILSPFQVCPKCQNDSYGVLNVGYGSYTRRCRDCWHTQSISLPELQKRIIYIDQFAISNMMKALNPETPAYKKGRIDPFWRKLFEKLDTLSKLQLIVCPDSDTHNSESRVSAYYKPLKRMYELLSHGTTFYDHQTIERFQVIEHLRNVISGKPGTASQLTAHNLVHGNLNQWTDRLLITYEIHVDDEAVEEIRRSRDELAEEIKNIFGRWQTEKNRSFNDWFEEEARAFGSTVLLAYENYRKSYGELISGKRAPTEKDVFPPAAVILVHEIKGELRAAGVPNEYLHQVTAGFLNSLTLREAPAIKVSSMLWAAIARKAAAGKRSRLRAAP